MNPDEVSKTGYQFFVPGQPIPYRERAYMQKCAGIRKILLCENCDLKAKDCKCDQPIHREYSHEPKPGFIRSYLHRSCKEWERQIKTVAGTISAGLLQGPVDAVVEFRLLRPKSRPKKFLKPDKKPDVENLAKAAIDGVNKILIGDDSQICDMRIRKIYCSGNEAPGVEIKLTENP